MVVWFRYSGILTEQQQQKLHICKNNWVRRMIRTKRVDGRRMNNLRKEVGIQSSLILTGGLVRSRMRWAGHFVSMDPGKLATSRGGETSRMHGKGKATAETGGLCDEGHEKTGEDETWREGGEDRKLCKERTL